MKFNLKSLLAVGLLAASASADIHSARYQCREEAGGKFLESFSSGDNRYMCFTPCTMADLKSRLYQATLDGFSGCYNRNYGNVAYCDVYSSQYDGRGCQMSVSYLSTQTHNHDVQARKTAKSQCRSAGGKFLATKDESDLRYICFTKCTMADRKSRLYQATLDGFDGCYNRNYGNVDACDVYSAQYNGRGCQMAVSYLYSASK